MYNTEDILRLRISGSNITPQSLKSKEVAELICSLEDAIFHFIKHKNPDISKDSVYISLVDIKSQSAGYVFNPSIKDALLAFSALTLAINTNNYIDIPDKAIESLKPIKTFTKNRNCKAEFFIGDERLTEITPNTIIEVPKTAYLRGESTIYGEVIRVGGMESKVVIKIDESKTLNLSISHDLAKEIAKKLYSVVGLVGDVKWSRFTHEILDFTPTHIIPYSGGSIVESFSILKNEIGQYWDKIDNINEALLIDDAYGDDLY